jgi:hypothetical protein
VPPTRCCRLDYFKISTWRRLSFNQALDPRFHVRVNIIRRDRNSPGRMTRQPAALDIHMDLVDNSRSRSIMFLFD